MGKFFILIGCVIVFASIHNFFNLSKLFLGGDAVVQALYLPLFFSLCFGLLMGFFMVGNGIDENRKEKAKKKFITSK